MEVPGDNSSEQKEKKSLKTAHLSGGLSGGTIHLVPARMKSLANNNNSNEVSDKDKSFSLKKKNSREMPSESRYAYRHDSEETAFKK